MKVILLLIAVYALIINQSLKQADGKAMIQTKKEKQAGSLRIDNYINTVFKESNPSGEAKHKYTPAGTESPASLNYMYPSGEEQEEIKPRTLLYPIDYPYPAKLEKKRS